MSVVVEALDAPRYRATIDGLAALLVDAVERGAGVNFMAGVTTAETRSWWLARADQVADGMIVPIVALEAGGGRVVGSVLLIYSATPNSPHRGEIGKVLVHSSARRRGLGRELMLAAESRARADGRWLLILDTVTGSDADRFYRSLGWNEVGEVPDFALMPDGTLTSTTYFWKSLR
ncbi:MAG: GNAT family N-acetyltransferase [Chloroflexi bacterium]|nr:GNAT family N-acetyltransferase [Chloroflexota bacterium]